MLFFVFLYFYGIIFRYLLKSSCETFASFIVTLFVLISLRKAIGFALH